MFIQVGKLLGCFQMNTIVRWELTQFTKICKAMLWVTKDRGLWFLENLTERFQEEIQHDEPWHFTAKKGCWLFLPRVDLLHPS